MRTSQNSSDSVRLYLKEIGRTPLLTHEQEVQYGKQVQRYMKLQEIKEELMEEQGQEPNLADWTQRADLTPMELKRQLRLGEVAKRKMIEANLRLVVSVAKKYSKQDLDLLDLVQEGAIGLHRGVEKFDPTKGYRFSTYSYWWIRQAITRALAEKGRTIRLPIHVTEKLNKIKKVQRKLIQKNGRSASIPEVAAELDMTVSQVRDCLVNARRVYSLDVRIGDDENTDIGSLLEDDGVTPEDYTTRISLQRDLGKLLTELPPKHQEVIALRFGLGNESPLTLEKVGNRLDISRERVRQIQRDAIKRLRQRKMKLKGYLAS